MPGEHAQHQLERFLADLFDGLFAGDDAAGVQIHIVLHALIGIGIAADLDDRHGREALRGAAPGREQHDLRTGSGHTGQDLGLTAGRVLDPQALLIVDAFGVFQHALDRTVAGLDDRTQALFLNAGQAARDIAGRRLSAAHVLADRLGAFFHAVHDLINLLPDRAVLAADRAAREDMLAAEELGRLAENDRAAQIDQLIRHIADHRVGGHAGSGVRCAALDRHDNVGNIHRLALLRGNLLHQLLRRVDARLDGA